MIILVHNLGGPCIRKGQESVHIQTPVPANYKIQIIPKTHKHFGNYLQFVC